MSSQHNFKAKTLSLQTVMQVLAPKTGSEAVKIKSVLVSLKWSRCIKATTSYHAPAAHTKKAPILEESDSRVTFVFTIKYTDTNIPFYLLLPFLASILRTRPSPREWKKHTWGEMPQKGEKVCVSNWLGELSESHLFISDAQCVTPAFILAVNFAGYLPEKSS